MVLDKSRTLMSQTYL